MICLDTETTGLTKPSAGGQEIQPRIIDLAMIKLSPETGAEIGRIEFLIQPEIPLDKDIQRITGYKDEDLLGKPLFSEVLPIVEQFCIGEMCWIAHNLNFDRDMIFWELVRLGRERAFPWPPQQLCTVQLYEPELGRRAKLTELYERKLGRPLAQKHTAMADVEALVEVIRKEELFRLENPR